MLTDQAPQRIGSLLECPGQAHEFPVLPVGAECVHHLAEVGTKLDVVLQLTADDEELVSRLLGRAKETGRSDDNEAVIRHRLDLYHEQTEAVVAKYAERGILTQVDGIGGIDEVTDRVMAALDGAR